MTLELQFLKSTVLLAAAWLVTRALASRSAAARAAVWSAALAVLLALPLLELGLPAWRPLSEPVPPTVAVAPATAASPALPNAPSSIQNLGVAHDHNRGASALRGPGRGARVARVLAPITAGLWLAGLALLLARLIVAHVRARAAVRRAVPAGPRIERLAAHVAGLVVPGRIVRVAIADPLDVPVQTGVLRPVVLLPRGASDWPMDRLRAVLLHELAHVRRRDCLAQLLGELARAAYWPNPLVHLAVRRAALEQERACDDTVLRVGAPATRYAEHLAAVAALVTRTPAPAAALAMARPSTLRARVRAILDPAADHRALGRRALLGTAVVAAALALPLGAMRLLGEGAEARLARTARLALAAADAAGRRDAAFTLGRLRDSESRAALTARLGDADPQVRGVAAWALGRLGERGAAPDLIAALRDADPYVRETAVLALAALGDRRAVGALEPMTRDSIWSVRAVTTSALGDLGGDEAGRALAVMVRTEPEEHTRSMATWALASTRSTSSLPGLLALLDDTSTQVRRDALGALEMLGSPDAAPRIARLLGGERVPALRGAAAWTLGRLGDQRGAAALEAAAVRDSVWQVRSTAVVALGHLGGPVAERAVVAALRDPVHQVRLNAVKALDRIASR